MTDPIQNAELIFYKVRHPSDDWRISGNVIINNTLQNTFGHAFSAERTAGSTTHVCLFMLVANANNKTLFASLFRFFEPTEGDDFCCFFDGTGLDSSGDIVGTERKYGVGTLNTTVTAGGVTLIVDVQDASHASGNDLIAVDGDKVIITDKATYDASSGNLEQKAIDGTVTVSGTELTVTLDTQLANGYTAWDPETRTGAKVMFCKDFGDIATSFDSWVETCAGTGVYDEGAYPPILDNQGTMDMEVTLTFTDATNFTATSDDPDLTALGSGTTGADFSPTNTILPGSHPLFTLEYLGWDLVWAAGDTIVFKIYGSSVKVVEKRVIPALCGPLTGNKLILVTGGESA